MANKLLLRILVAARPGIQAGKLKMQDIVSEYFKQTGGKTIDPGDRAIIENELSPLSDMRASSHYRHIVSQNLLERFYLEVKNNRSETFN